MSLDNEGLFRIDVCSGHHTGIRDEAAPRATAGEAGFTLRFYGWKSPTAPQEAPSSDPEKTMVKGMHHAMELVETTSVSSKHHSQGQDEYDGLDVENSGVRLTNLPDSQCMNAGARDQPSLHAPIHDSPLTLLPFSFLGI